MPQADIDNIEAARLAEGTLSDRIDQAGAIVAVCAMAARSGECKIDQIGIALEAALALLNGSYDDLEVVRDALDLTH